MIFEFIIIGIFSLFALSIGVTIVFGLLSQIDCTSGFDDLHDPNKKVYFNEQKQDVV
jgi:hypothetical protein